VTPPHIVNVHEVQLFSTIDATPIASLQTLPKVMQQ